jgi:hypothetical protein
MDGQTLELQSPTLLYMVLKDAKGSELAKSNPQAAPPADQHIDFTAPADGDYYLEVQHLNYLGGPSEVYRVTVVPYEPGFDLTLGIERYDVSKGGLLMLPIATVTRRDYAGPIEVSVVGPPGITGHVTIQTPPAPNQPVGYLPVRVASDLTEGPYNLLVQARANINGREVVAIATQRVLVSQALSNLPYPPHSLLQQVGLAVTEKAPFTLAARFAQLESLRGGPVEVTLTATRAAGCTEEIAVAVAGLPPNVAAALKNIPKEQNEIQVQLTPAANAPVGSFPVHFTGKTKVQNKESTVSTEPVPLVLVLPFDLKVESTPLKVTQGDKAKLRLTVTRKAGYQGPIEVELRNLPDKVTAGKTTIPQGQTEVEIEIAAAADAAPGDKADVNVLGTATAAGNQQNASANFTLSVQQK